MRADSLGDPDNFIQANPVVTPPEIKPEWYLRPFYAILRAMDFNIGRWIQARWRAVDVCVDRGDFHPAVARYVEGALDALPPAARSSSCSSSLPAWRWAIAVVSAG